MSQIVTLINDAPVLAPAALVLAITWAALVVITALVATFSRTTARQDAAMRVLERLLRCLPVRGRT